MLAGSDWISNRSGSLLNPDSIGQDGSWANPDLDAYKWAVSRVPCRRDKQMHLASGPHHQTGKYVTAAGTSELTSPAGQLLRLRERPTAFADADGSTAPAPKG